MFERLVDGDLAVEVFFAAEAGGELADLPPEAGECLATGDVDDQSLAKSWREG
jgi:hypothetical protein